MPFLWFAYWTAILFFVGGGWLVSGVLSLNAWRRKWPVLKWIFSVCFAAFTFVAFYGVISYAHDCYLDSLPSMAFQRAFHREPRGVQLLHGHSGHFVDSAWIDLAFHADREIFESLQPESMERGTIEEYRRHDIYKPKWWRNPGPETEIWIKDRTYSATDGDRSPAQNFGSELTIMTWDADGLVQFYWSGID